MSTFLRRCRNALAMIACTAAAIGSVSACSNTPPGGNKAQATGGKLVVGHAYQDLTNKFFADELKSEQTLAKSQGATLVTAQANDNPATQLDNINTLIARKVNVLVIDAIDPQAIVPGIRAANEAGIPVMMLIREPNSGASYESLLYLDSVTDGKNACTAIAKKLGGKGNVVNLTGPMQIQAAKERAQGCDQALKAYPGIKVVAEVNTDYTLRDANLKMTDVLTAHPNVDGVFGGNDEIALGALRAVVAAHKDPKKMAIVGVDGTLPALQAICNGTMLADYATFGSREAQLVFDTVGKIHAGQTVQKKVLFPAVPITPDNVTSAAAGAGIPLGNCPAAKG
jgi:ABC-type sugar transport system substrate-binding protein